MPNIMQLNTEKKLSVKEKYFMDLKKKKFSTKPIYL